MTNRPAPHDGVRCSIGMTAESERSNVMQIGTVQFAMFLADAPKAASLLLFYVAGSRPISKYIHSARWT
jgi:hypothetical protein